MYVFIVPGWWYIILAEPVSSTNKNQVYYIELEIIYFIQYWLEQN